MLPSRSKANTINNKQHQQYQVSVKLIQVVKTTSSHHG